MKIKPSHLTLSTTLALALSIAGCGGGSSDSPAASSPLAATTTPPVVTQPAPTPTPATSIQGTTATGAPFAGATITITDKTGAPVGTGVSGADGSFNITLAAGAAAPYVLTAVRDDQTLVSISPDPTAGTINITPITSLIAARLSPSGDPTKLAAELKADPTLVSATRVTASTTEVVTLLKPLFDALGTNVNPLTGAFTANGTGADRVLDSLSIRITPQTGGTSNIEVSVKQAQDDTASPTVVQFSSNAASIAALPAVTPAKLIPSGTAPLIASLLAKMTACQALPVADRVNTPNTNGIGASDIKAAACKEIFYNNDPTTFKSGGRVVGSNGAFSGIFRDGGNNVVYDRGTYEFTRTNGDLVIGYRATDASGNVTTDTFAVRPDSATAPTKLQQIGNQYQYDGSIRAYHQLREFVNQPGNAYYSTGYVPSVANTLSGGNPIFAKVVVTAPNGRSVVLKPKTGYGTLQLVKNAGTTQEVVTGTSFIRIRSEYVGADKAALDPRDADTRLFFSSPGFTEAEVVAIQQQGVWRYDYYLAGNATTTPDATQNYRTRTRALSIGELKAQPLAALGTEETTYLSTNTPNGYFAAPSEGLDISWTVGSGALAPTSLQAFGFITQNSVTSSFSDAANVGSTTRESFIRCIPKSVQDNHCTTTVPNVASMYATGAQINGLHLFARDESGREYAHFYATYNIGTNGE